MTHGHNCRGRRSPTYQSWVAMRNRCRNPRQLAYKDYGGRGIACCTRWETFANFLADMGERPEGTTLDRRDNDKGYSQENCHWATRTQQNRNTRTNKLDEHKAHQVRWLAEMGYSQSHIGRMYGIDQTTVSGVVLGKAWR